MLLVDSLKSLVEPVEFILTLPFKIVGKPTENEETTGLAVVFGMDVTVKKVPLLVNLWMV